MTVYLLHFFPALAHAKHYIGWTNDDDAVRRSLEHKNGTQKGSPLIRAALAAGATIKLARIWEGADRKFERKLKKRKNAARLCPCCNPRTAMQYGKQEFLTFIDEPISTQEIDNENKNKTA